MFSFWRASRIRALALTALTAGLLCGGMTTSASAAGGSSTATDGAGKTREVNPGDRVLSGLTRTVTGLMGDPSAATRILPATGSLGG
ncbi:MULTISPECIES: hypothetical protein [Streptomyces]|uniref:Uncharacterized protein n=3 Tax=Streptomyces TaxID=1883 RepID=A0A3Q9FTI1_STRLT|nr:hypothetical protein [Streptomyces luteoverticillatus]AZQ69970.1 hypothetical protein EKH77_00925 [Streptomyces luteoverticillatus]